MFDASSKYTTSCCRDPTTAPRKTNERGKMTSLFSSKLLTAGVSRCVAPEWLSVSRRVIAVIQPTFTHVALQVNRRPRSWVNVSSVKRKAHPQQVFQSNSHVASNTQETRAQLCRNSVWQNIVSVMRHDDRDHAPRRVTQKRRRSEVENEAYRHGTEMPTTGRSESLHSPTRGAD